MSSTFHKVDPRDDVMAILEVKHGDKTQHSMLQKIHDGVCVFLFITFLSSYMMLSFQRKKLRLKIIVIIYNYLLKSSQFTT